MHHYTVYRAEDDQLVAFGIARECAKALKLSSTASFYCLVCNVMKGKNRKYEILVETETPEDIKRREAESLERLKRRIERYERD